MIRFEGFAIRKAEREGIGRTKSWSKGSRGERRRGSEARSASGVRSPRSASKVQEIHAHSR